MKILALRADNGGCANYRIIEPVRVAQQAGIDISVDISVDVEAYEHKVTKLVEVKEINSDVDCIIIQRPLDNSFVSLIKQAKKQGIATVVELDDDFSSIHQNNTAHDAVTKLSFSNSKWIEEACKEADWVTVSTPALLKYGRHGRISVLRNYVPESIFQFQPKYEINKEITQLTIGWTGTVATHPTDLQVTQGHINKILEKNNLKFHVIGNEANVKKNLKISDKILFSKNDWVPLSEYYQAIHTNIDIGISPLEISNFNNAKSYLKGLEMGALGIPFVASPTKEYEVFEAYGIGKLAKSPGDWSKHIQKWIDDPGLYQKDAKQYRDNIQQDFTYEQHVNDWIDAWSNAVAYRKKN